MLSLTQRDWFQKLLQVKCVDLIFGLVTLVIGQEWMRVGLNGIASIFRKERGALMLDDDIKTKIRVSYFFPGHI